ncbi:MAG: MotA/TolQ/ExbB proton channel family protein [Blastocatellia bacterium]
MDQLIEIIWPSNQTLGQLINLAIIVFFFVAARYAILHTRRYRQFETIYLDAVIGKVRRWVEQRSPGGEKGKRTKLQPLADMTELKQGIPRESIIGDRLEAIAEMRTAHVKINPTALQQMSLAKEAPKKGLALPGFVVGLSMMLGLLGTFIGLVLMVQNIDALLPQAQSGEIGKLQNVLGGMKTAFSTTLVGLISSITTSWLNFRLARAQAVFFEQLERFTIEELLPATVPALEDDSLLEKVSRQLDGSFERLDVVTARNEEMLQQLDGIQQAFLDIITAIKETTRNQTTESYYAVLGKLTEVVNEMGAVNRAVLGIAQEVPKLVAETKQSHQALSQEVKALLQENREQQSGLAIKVSSPLAQMTALLQQISQDLKRGVLNHPSDSFLPPHPVAHLLDDLESALAARRAFLREYQRQQQAAGARTAVAITELQAVIATAGWEAATAWLLQAPVNRSCAEWQVLRQVALGRISES